MSTIGKLDALKLYLIDKAVKAFGSESVSRVVENKGLELYCYIDAARNPGKGEALLDAAFPLAVFGADDVLGSVTMETVALEHSGEAKEQLYKVRLTGSLTEILDNVQKNDPDGLAAALKSQRSIEILKREGGLKGREGAVRT